MASSRIMNIVTKRIWTTALRSGRYNQAGGGLRKTEFFSEKTIGHCCLGVLRCEISGRQPSREAHLLRDGAFGLSRNLQLALAHANDGSHVSVRRRAFKKAGFDTIPGASKSNGRSTFSQIADWIDKNL